MVDWSRYPDDFLIRHFGVMTHDWGTVYPDLSQQIRTMLLDRMAQMPWLPSDWASTVRYLHGKDGKVLVPVPSTATHSQGRGADFLDTDAKRQVWDALAERVRQARLAYGDKKLAEGRALMEKANANAEFWDRAYNLARVLAAPVTGVKKLWENPKVLGTILWGGLGLLVLYRIWPMLKRPSKD